MDALHTIFILCSESQYFLHPLSNITHCFLFYSFYFTVTFNHQNSSTENCLFSMILFSNSSWKFKAALGCRLQKWITHPDSFLLNLLSSKLNKRLFGLNFHLSSWKCYYSVLRSRFQRMPRSASKAKISFNSSKSYLLYKVLMTAVFFPAKL